MSTQNHIDFTNITGADAATADRYLATANWNLELAISNYFDAASSSPPNVGFHNAPVVNPAAPAACFPLPRMPHPYPHPMPVPPPILPPVVDDGELPVITQLKAGSVILPLHGLSVVLNVNQYVAEVQVLQRFVNMESNPIEAIFTFQQEDVSIYEFYAEIAGKKIVSVCKEKQAAFDMYDDALAGGHGGYLLDKESEDQFKLNVGNLPPFAECVISIKYATTVSTDGEALKFTIPITKVAIMLRGGEVVNWDTKTTSDIPNGLSLRANIHAASPIFGIESETHEIKYEVNGNFATLSLAGDPTQQPAREFTCLIGLQEPHKSASSVVEVREQTKNSPGINTSVMLCFYPTIENLEDDDVLMEYVFLVDRSGSMAGSRMSQLINALQLLLRSIPVGSLFNIVGFGSTYERLFPSSLVYDDSSFATATNHAATLKANLVSTNILPPLYDILSKPTHAKFPRQLFVLTDGEVDNTEQVISMVKKNIGSTRIFTIGIGAEASKRLVKGLAKAGKGHAELVNSGVRMEPIVLGQLKRAMQPHLAVEVDWGTLAKDVKQAPTNIPPVFPGQPVVVFGMLNRNVTSQDNNVALKLSPPHGETRYVPVSFSDAPSPGSMIGVLAASAIISDVERKLEDKVITESVAKNTIVPLATKYSLVTKYTSLVAQEIREDGTEGTMEVRRVGELVPPEVNVLKPQPQSHMVGFGPGGRASTSVAGRGGFGGLGAAQPHSYSVGGSGGRGRGGGDRGSRAEGRRMFKKSISSDEARQKRQDAQPEIRKSKREESLNTRRSSSQAGGYTTNSSSPTYLLDSISSIQYSRKASSDLFEEESDDSDDWNSEHFAAAPPPPPAHLAAPAPVSAPFGSASHFSTPPSSARFDSYETHSFSAAPAAATSRPDPTKRPLDLFVILQQASGNWTLSPDFLSSIGKTKAQIEAVFGSLEGWLANVAATALAVVFMEIKFSDTIDEWNMLKDKAIRWMTKELKNKNSTEKVDHFIQQARKVLQ